MIELEASIQEYNENLHNFKLNKSLPPQWFEYQDHLAFKAYNPDDYERLIKQFLPISEYISETWMNSRRLAAAKIIGEHSVSRLVISHSACGYVSWIEIMEAKPDDRSNEPVRLDHAEIHLPRGLIPVKNVLRRRGIEFFDESNPKHAWVSVIMNPSTGDELKFNDRLLSVIVEEELRTGEAVKL